MIGGGAGRRLTAGQEERAAVMFAAGASEREVADELGCSASTAHRLRLRLEGEPQEDAELAALQQMRVALAEQIADHQGRAEASRKAIGALTAERDELLAEGKDAAPLRSRVGSAVMDLEDWTRAAELLAPKLAAVDARIAGIEARRELTAMRAVLAAAVAERDEVLAGIGDRQRAAVLAVKSAAEEFVATYREEEAARLRVEQLATAVTAGAVSLGEPLPDVPAAVGTMLQPPHDAIAGPALALVRATYRAREGNVAAVAVQLAETLGWLPPDPAELAADLERMRQMYAQQQRPPQPQGEPWTRPDASPVSLDAHGQEIRWAGWRPPLPAHPLDAYPR